MSHKIHSLSFNKFIQLYNNYHNLILECFHLPESFPLPTFPIPAPIPQP